MLYSYYTAIVAAPNGVMPLLSRFPLLVFAYVAGGVRGASQSPRQRAPQRLAGEVREEDGHGRSRAHRRQYPGRRRAQVTRNVCARNIPRNYILALMVARKRLHLKRC